MTKRLPPNTNPVDWLFRSRHSGRLVIVQWPNLPLWLVIGAFLVRWLLHPAGVAGTVVTIVGTLSLLTWAALEAWRGVNPWRRLLGGGVGVAQVAMLLLRR